jgi:AcrR family transcriptional regulator
MKKLDLREERELQRRREIRQSIIHAAEEVIGRKGYGSATMDDVARGAQVSKATLYQYVPNKSELVTEIFLHYFEDVEQEFDRVLAVKAGAADKIKSVIRFYLEFRRDKENISNVLFMDPKLMKNLRIFFLPGKPDSSKEKAILNRFKEKREAIFKKACELVRQGILSGEFHDLDARQAVIFINSVLEGFSHGRYWFGEKMALGQEVDFLSRFLLRGIQGMVSQNDKGDRS